MKKNKRDFGDRFYESKASANDNEERLTGGTSGWKEQLGNWNASKSWRAPFLRHRRRVSISLPHSLFRSLFISLPRFHLPPKCRECNGLVVEWSPGQMKLQFSALVPRSNARNKSDFPRGATRNRKKTRCEKGGKGTRLGTVQEELIVIKTNGAP